MNTNGASRIKQIQRLWTQNEAPENTRSLSIKFPREYYQQQLVLLSLTFKAFLAIQSQINLPRFAINEKHRYETSFKTF